MNNLNIVTHQVFGYFAGSGSFGKSGPLADRLKSLQDKLGRTDRQADRQEDRLKPLQDKLDRTDRLTGRQTGRQTLVPQG